MTLFYRRFLGALMLDASAFEEIEAHRESSMHSAMTLLLACAAGGVAVTGLGLTGITGFLTGAVVVLGAWLVWVTVIAALGTIAFPEPQTRSSVSELLRTLGFATAPGVLLVFAAMREVAPFVVALVSLWTIAAAVLGLRQALDYRSTPRAIAVCALGWLIALGVIGAVAGAFSVELNS